MLQADGASASDTKRVRLERSDLERILFSLFEKQGLWNLYQLQRQTEQPAAWLKVRAFDACCSSKKQPFSRACCSETALLDALQEVLSDIAVQNKRGPNKDLWEIKKGRC